MHILHVTHFSMQRTGLHLGLALGLYKQHLSSGCGGNFSNDFSQFSCTLFKACHDRCTFRHVYFSKNGLASCTVLTHAHSSTDSACIVVTTVNTGQTHWITTALRGCILYLFATYRKSQQVKHLFTPTG